MVYKELPVDHDTFLLSIGDDGQREYHLGCSPPRSGSPSYKFSLLSVYDLRSLLILKTNRPKLSTGYNGYHAPGKGGIRGGRGGLVDHFTSTQVHIWKPLLAASLIFTLIPLTGMITAHCKSALLRQAAMLDALAALSMGPGHLGVGTHKAAP